MNFSSDDLMTVSSPQVIRGHKTFGNNLTILGDAEMSSNKAIDGVDLSQLQREAAYKDKNQTITGAKHIKKARAKDVTVKCIHNSCYLEELLTNLSKKTVKVNQSAYIAGLKVFTKDLVIESKLGVKGYLNGVKEKVDLAHKGRPLILDGKKTFSKAVSFNGETKLHANLNGFNVSQWYVSALRTDGDQNITGNLAFTNELRFENNLAVIGDIDGMRLPDDFVKVHGNEIIFGQKMLQGQIKINELTANRMIVDGLIDGVDVNELNKTILKKEGGQTFSGNVTFENGLVVNGNLDTGGNINSINLTKASSSALEIFGDQIISGRKVRLH